MVLLAQDQDGRAPFVSVPFQYIKSLAQAGRGRIRYARDVIVDAWLDELDTIHEEYLEDKCQFHCHSHRLVEGLRDGLKSLSRHTPKTFPKFGQLPAEIRLQIWEEALPGPRAVMLKTPYPSSQTCLAQSLKLKKAEPVDEVWGSSVRPPALLHVNSESRYVALKKYHLALGTETQAPRVYIDFEHDYVSLSRDEMDERCDALWAMTADLDKIRHLAVSYWGYDRFTRLPPLWRRFGELQDIMMVRSVRWQYGKVPKKAKLDFEEWSEREIDAEGIAHWYTQKSEDGVMSIRGGRKPSRAQALSSSS